MRDMKAEEFVKAVSSGRKLTNGYGTTVEKNEKGRIFISAPGYAVSADELNLAFLIIEKLISPFQ